MAKTKSWDSTLKRLIHVNPNEFVQWLIPNATYLSEQPSELESLQREVDILLQVMMNGQRMLLHIEFQTYNDRDMAERLLLYNVLARNAHKLPVFSCVIYLLKDGVVPQSPFRITFPDGELIHEFRFESIEIGQLTPDDILNIDSITLLPLLPLTQGGASREVIDRMFTKLKEQREAEAQVTELETIGYTLASFVLQKKSAVDQEWLIRRFREMHDIFRDTPIFQEILREGMEEGIGQGIKRGIEQGREEGIGQGIKQGREQGIEQGRLEAARHILYMLTERRFPDLAALAQEQAAKIQDMTTLDKLIITISSVQNELEAYYALRGRDIKSQS